MRINTITTWADYNYGASLQAYALTNYIKSRGHDVEMIKYLPPYQTRMYDYWWVNPESKASKWMLSRMVYRVAKIAQRLTTLGRKKIFDKFNFEVIPQTKQPYKSYTDLCQNPPKADLFIVGSDQVWNVLYDAGRDPSFFLEFVKDGKKASYAASFSYLDIDNENKIRIANSLKKFDAIAVREYHGQEFLKSIGLISTWVLDPVFLLPLNSWNELANHSILDEKDDYLLIYDFESNKELENFAKYYAHEHKLKIYAIADKYPLRYADRNFRKAGPVEFVSLISGCKCFVSNSFHGSAFSIMYHKPFFVFNRKRHKVNSRMESLLTLFELKDVLVDNETQYEYYVNMKFNWDKVEQIRTTKLQESVEYLKRLGV